jgi:uncharacterized SAM-binding protein YcdF (DUF218 family)
VNTEDNFLQCKNIFVNSKLINNYFQEGWVKSIIICTSTFHAKRAFVVAQNVFSSYNIPIKVIHTNETVDSTTASREKIHLDNYLQNLILLNSAV